MDTDPTRTLADPEQASVDELEAALLHFDELDGPSLERLSSHPVHGPRLAVLQGAERWLSRAEPADLPALETCPTAEDLYDHGRGPGFEPLHAASEAAVRAHLRGCEACRALVASLESAPPLPLELGEPEPVPPAPPRRPRSLHPRHHLILLAAAAGLLLTFFFAPTLFSPRPLAGLPEPPVYRGTHDSSLLFPRGPVLARVDGAGAPSARPSFELRPIEGAERYLVELFLHDGEAFEPGRLVQRLEGSAPTLTSDPLPPGHYTWQAWAVVRGLDQELGALEFEVRPDAPLAARLAALGTSPSTRELVRTVSSLHEAGYRTDARELARRLPESRERDAYLGPPGR